MSSGTSTSSDTDVVICSPLRTPVGRMGGALAPLTVTDLATTLLRELATRTVVIGPEA